MPTLLIAIQLIRFALLPLYTPRHYCHYTSRFRHHKLPEAFVNRRRISLDPLLLAVHKSAVWWRNRLVKWQ